MGRFLLLVNDEVAPVVVVDDGRGRLRDVDGVCLLAFALDLELLLCEALVSGGSMSMSMPRKASPTPSFIC